MVRVWPVDCSRYKPPNADSLQLWRVVQAACGEGGEVMIYSAVGSTVWRGYEVICQAADDDYAQAIAEAMNKYESEGADGN